MGSLSAIDYAIVLLYLAATTVVGLWVSVYVRTGREFFLAGRTLPWWAVGLSLVATDIGGTDLIGVGGAAYRHGLAVGNFEWIGCVPAMIVAAFVFIPHFWRCGVTTIPEFLERRFDVKVRTAVALCWLAFMACNLGVMLLASAKLMDALAGWPVPLTIGLVAALVCFYTWTGGLAAVVYTDVLQGIVMIAGCVLVVIVGLWNVGGWTSLEQRVEQQVESRELSVESQTSTPSSITLNSQPSTLNPPRFEHFSLVLPVDTSSPFPWTGILFGLALVISPAYWIGNQAIVQRALGARSEYEAKASYVWGALLKNVIPLVIAVPGLIALAKFPGLTGPETDKALPLLIGETMPLGLKGVFVAAFLAALMSSIDSYLSSAATIVTNDFYLRFMRPTADERRVLRIGRMVTIALTVWAIAFAWHLSRYETGIYTIFQTLIAFFNGPAFAVLLTGLVFKSANRYGALAGFIGGVVTAVSLFLLNHPALYERFEWRPLFQIQDPYLYFSVWAFLVSLAVIGSVSYATKPDPSEKQQFALGNMPSAGDAA
uniref:Sodium transporter n=1 Tax=Schlesneria paludicola TaxID=360056 RepID=A0A7C2JXQ6_9PLAN